MSITVSIPTYNRFTMVIECFEQILYDNRVDEIVIVDDASIDNSWENLYQYYKYEPKVTVYLNNHNRDCYANKRASIAAAKTEWCLLADSDNIFSVDYLDKIFDYSWDKSVIYTPSFAAPHFNFEAYSGLLITKENVAEYIDKPMFETMLNACNYFVNRKSYLEVWDGSINPVTSDSIYMAYKWLESGRGIYVVPNLIYQHTVHEGSHYRTKNHLTPIGFHEHILQSIKELK